MSGDDDIRFVDLVQGIRPYRWVIAVAAILAFAATLLTMTARPRIYESMTTVQVTPPKFVDPLPLLVEAAKMVDVAGPPVYNLSPANFLPILTSRAVAATVIRDLSLPGTTPSAFVNDVITVEPVRGTMLIQVTARWQDRETAVKIAQRVVDTSIATVAQLLAQEESRARDIFRQQRQEAEQRFVAADAAVRASATGGSVPAGARESELKRLEIDRDLAAKRYAALTTLYETAHLQVAARSPHLEVLDPAVPADVPMPRGAVRNSVVAGLATLTGGAILAILAHLLRRPSRPSSL